VLTGVAVWSVIRSGGIVDRPLQRFAIHVPPSAPVLGGSLTVSNDGTRLVYIAQEGGRRILYVRDLAQLEPQPIRGSEGAYQPFLSPDGEWVGFFTEAGQSSGKLKKVPVRGGPAIELCDALGPHGGAWGDDGTIVFAAGNPGSSSGGLFKVSAAGGEPVALTKPDIKTELRHGWPNVLPNGKGIVVSILPRGALYDSGRIAVYSPGDGSMQTIVPSGYHGRYVDSGHIVYVAPGSSAPSGNLMAIPFDIDRLRTTGPPVPVLEGVVLGARSVGSAGFAISSSGVLTYVPASGNSSSRRTLVWVDRQGREEPLGVPERAYVYPRLSPDGSQVALDIRDDQNDIWVLDLARQSLSMVTKDPGLDRFPVWSADGKRIAYASPRDGTLDSIYIQAADGTGAVQRLTETEVAHAPLTFTNDGTRLLVREGGAAAATGGVLKVLSLASDRALIPLIQPPTPVMNAEMSPDGRWLVYQSSESGRQEVYVRPFPDVNSARYSISTSGGTRPLWSRNGRELFYLTGAIGDAVSVMAVAVQAGTSFTAGRPQKLFEGRYFGNVDTYVARSYDVSPDGGRFLMIKEQTSGEQSSGSPALVLVLNWADELKRIARPQN
jgi:serine/threonine-protein kinase